MITEKLKIKRFLAASRLVAQTFLWLDINNKKKKNRVDNLFLWTNRDNTQDAIQKWKKEYAFRKWINHPNSKQILQYSLNWDFIKDGDE